MNDRKEIEMISVVDLKMFVALDVTAEAKLFLNLRKLKMINYFFVNLLHALKLFKFIFVVATLLTKFENKQIVSLFNLESELQHFDP